MHKVPKSASQVVLRRVQPTLHATRRTPHGASRLWWTRCLSNKSKADVLHPGIVGMRGSMIIRRRPCTSWIHSRPPSPHPHLHPSGDPANNLSLSRDTFLEMATRTCVDRPWSQRRSLPMNVLAEDSPPSLVDAGYSTGSTHLLNVLDAGRRRPTTEYLFTHRWRCRKRDKTSPRVPPGTKRTRLSKSSASVPPPPFVVVRTNTMRRITWGARDGRTYLSTSKFLLLSVAGNVSWLSVRRDCVICRGQCMAFSTAGHADLTALKPRMLWLQALLNRGSHSNPVDHMPSNTFTNNVVGGATLYYCCFYKMLLHLFLR